VLKKNNTMYHWRWTATTGGLPRASGELPRNQSMVQRRSVVLKNPPSQMSNRAGSPLIRNASCPKGLGLPLLIILVIAMLIGSN